MGNYLDKTIKEAMKNIEENTFLLPAIQRKFVWSTEQIEMLFDSILRDYPINSFMMWEIKDQKIKQDYKFYYFIKDYQQRYKEDNPDASTKMIEKTFYAIIDGQQRLTSIYIGLEGTYRIKRPSKWWADNEEVMPFKRLYLELSSPYQSEKDVDIDKEYNFKFLSDEELQKDISANNEHIWFKVGDITKYEQLSDLDVYFNQNNLQNSKYSKELLFKLWNKINVEEKLSFYTVNEQNQNKVLDIFVRANSGGTPLSFSDLLMSIASANWTKKDARKEMEDIKKQIFSFGNPNFDVSQDFILKSALVLCDIDDIRFRIDNFGRSNVKIIEDNWDKIKKCLISTFCLLKQLGFNNNTLRAKNAAIPIAYYLYKNNLFDEIIKNKKQYIDNKKIISKWLSMALLRGLFGGQSDLVLSKTREIIKNSKTKEFPIKEIINSFKGDPTKNYDFNDEIIDSFINSEYGTTECSLLLRLLYPSVVLDHGSNVAEDHMHPKTIFEDNDKFNSLGILEDKKTIYKENYNSLVNLQLLDTLSNESKGDMSLKEWANQNKKSNFDLKVEDNVNLDILYFEDFIKSRKKKLKEEIINIIRY